ncbi:hypothetical protein BDV32DRAFT_144686 [Aspergillus pseudonomiae]|uniref:Uncharacterized protein n=1 Tax=Aspergillus pseudonomiae TaxID=1506151 RepID=A0A5N7D7G7_9EURO|nr:uncharacterized protein BDV37DRAFT_295401 [Aspergillus pseudonomiae]KAB8265396.1 hypothetical protein BDV32DRAFT_144686 [Aspergillus pseudonomiae]KAE8402400.1 hypothetical protein BDV37DRAFT_295401 [Aspergillus pseudonomiae]
MTYITSFLVSLLVGVASANPASVHDQQGSSQALICPGLKTVNNGCIRYTRGFDVTGVTTEVDLKFPHVKNECDCIQECLKRLDSCANYVWKFSTPESVKSGHRTCTLYSNFNLPPKTNLDFNVDKSTNIQLLSPENNPQMGGLVPQAFKDQNLNTTPDPDAVSGPVWALADGSVQC